MLVHIIVFMSLLCFHYSYVNDAEKTVETLRAISQVKRFDMALMLIPKSDKHAFSKIFDTVATLSPQADLASIRKCFKL